jgi:hypothetical protein
MKNLIILSFLFLFSFTKAQSMYTDRANNTLSSFNQEVFSVTFENSAHGVTFRQNERTLNNDLKTKIERFMKDNREPKYRNLGTITLDIIKRNNIYYVVHTKSPERLLELK